MRGERSVCGDHKIMQMLSAAPRYTALLNLDKGADKAPKGYADALKAAKGQPINNNF